MNTCVDCKQEKPVYMAYYFGGRCKDCIEVWLKKMPEYYLPNPYIRLVRHKEDES